MRTLPNTIAEIKNSTGYSIRCALLVEFTSGDYCYTSDGWDPGFADCSNRQRVLTWGGMSALLESGDPSAFAQAQFAVVIGDPDGELRDLFEDEQFQKRTCSLYWAIFTPGEAEPTYENAVRILRGTLVPPVVWREGDRAITMEMTDLSVDDETLVGARATVDDFAWISEENEGREIPIIYGKVVKVSPVLLNRGPVAKLLRYMSGATMSFVVDNSEKFEQNTPISVEIGNEIISGSFDGNLFTVTSRGDDLFTSTTTGASTGGCTLIDTNIGVQTWHDNRLVGYDLLITVDTSPWLKFTYSHRFSCTMSSTLPTIRVRNWTADEKRTVIRVIKDQDTLEWNAPFVVETNVSDDGSGNWDIEGAQLSVGAGVAYIVGTSPQTHQPGVSVLRFMGLNNTLQYAVGMGACTVRQVYVHGYVYKPRTYYLAGRGTSSSGSMSSIAQQTIIRSITVIQPKFEDAWIPLRSDLWSQEAGTAEGKDITILNLVRYPTQLTDYVCTGDDILVDVEGPIGGDGSVIVNPADVIENLYAANADIPSARELVAYWKMDEESGTTVGDTTDNDNNGALQGNATLVEGGGRVGGAVNFPGGVGDEVLVPNSASLQAGCTGPFSVAFWLKLDDDTTDQGIMTKAPDSPPTSGFDITWVGPATNEIRLNATGWANAVYAFDTKWHHVAVVVGDVVGARSDVQIYVDGVALTMTNSDIVAITQSTSPLRMGFTHYGGGTQLNGRMDDLRIYDRVMSAAEVAALASGATGGAAGGTDMSEARDQLSNWRMNFVRPDVVPLREFTADLAMQARCRIRWLGEVPELLYLGVDGGDADLEIAAENMLQHSATRSRDEMERAASRVTASWVESGKEHALTEVDADAESEIGQREFSVSAWAYDDEECPRALARFFLETMKKLHDRASLAATVHGVGLEPGDIIDLKTTVTGHNVIAEFDANLLREAGNFDDEDAWVRLFLNDVVLSTETPPAGVSVVYKLVEDATPANKYIEQDGVTVDALSVYTFAVRAKAAERNSIGLYLGTQGFVGTPLADFSLVDGSFVSAGVDSAGTVDLGDGWWLCWIRATADADTDVQQARIYLNAVGGYVGDGVSGVYLAGAQFYTGGTLDEYMPTWDRNGVRTNVSLVNAGMTRNAYRNRKLLVGGDEYDITENGLGFVRVAGDVDGDGHSVGDAVEITDPQAYDPFRTPLKGRAEEVVHEIGVEPDVLPREDLRIRMFRWAGCSLACEGACETTACETACESYYEPSIDCWTCETSCQTACEHFCESGAELFCSDHACETALVWGCEVDCQVAEMAGGPPCGFCQTSCQSMCESATCETSGNTDN